MPTPNSVNQPNDKNPSTKACITLLDAYEYLCNTKGIAETKKKNVGTSLFRYYAKGLKGRKTAKARFNQKMLAAARNHVSEVIITNDFNRDELLATLEKGFDLLDVSDSTRNPARSHFRFLLKHIEESILGRTKKVKKTKAKKAYSPHDKIIDKSYLAKNKVKRKNNEKIILIGVRLEPELYTDRLKNKYPNLSEAELLNLANQELLRISQDIDKWEKYYISRAGNIRSFANIKKDLLRLLGWFYKTNKILTIEDIKLTLLIEPINIIVDRSDYNYDLNKIYIEEGRLRDKAKKVANNIIKFLKHYFNEYGVSHKGSAISYINSVKSLCKYLHKDITGYEYSYEDIPTIKYLKILTNEIKENKEFKPPQQKFLPLNWEEIQSIHHALKKDADEDYYYDNRKGKIKRRKKSIGKKIYGFQNFLIFGCFTVIPPDRQRTIREFEFGRTLRYGKLDNNGFLMDTDPRADENNESKYWIFHTAEDHKIGSKTNKSRLLPIINRQYLDGSCFYDYLTKWIFEFRKQVNPNTNTVFFGNVAKKAFTTSTLSNKIKHIIKRKTGVEVNVHLLRDIFTTYEANNGASLAEKKANCKYLNHGLETHDKTYNQQTDNDIIKVLVEGEAEKNARIKEEAERLKEQAEAAPFN